MVSGSPVAVTSGFGELERHRRELTGYCYRMLGSPFEAEDAVQDTLLRAWRALDRFEGRAALRSWLYRIATNVCLDMLSGRERRARPMDLGPARAPVVENLDTLPEVTWLEPVPDGLVARGERSRGGRGLSRDDAARLRRGAPAPAAAPARRPDPLRGARLEGHGGGRAARHERRVGEQRPSTGAGDSRGKGPTIAEPAGPLEEPDKELLARYVEAFERYDMEALTSLIHEDATQSMPPYSLWLRGRDDILTWWLGPGIGCRGSRVIPAGRANDSPAFGQYKPSPSGDGHEPWALQVIEIEDGRIVEITFFLATETLFPLFGLPPRLSA